jgi:copper chaperone CopZ
MSLLKENIIPGNHGKVFSTNAKGVHELGNIKAKVLELDGVEDVQLNLDVFPREFTVFTSKLITLEEIEEKVRSTGFHSITKNILER